MVTCDFPQPFGMLKSITPLKCNLMALLTSSWSQLRVLQWDFLAAQCIVLCLTSILQLAHVPMTDKSAENDSTFNNGSFTGT